LLVGLVHFSRLTHNVIQHLRVAKETAGQNTALTDCVLSTSDITVMTSSS